MDEMDRKKDEVLRKSQELDIEAYRRAKEQATKLSQFLMEHDECSKMIIDIGDHIFDLDIWHTDVLNELYIMLEALTKLEGDK